MSAIEQPVIGSGSLYTPRTAIRRRRPPRPQRQRATLATLATRLTPKDLWLIEMLHEHRVLTTHHLCALTHVSRRSVNRRLRTLYFLDVVDSFRPMTPTGSAPEHYTLGRTGADVLAATRGTDLSALRWRKDLLARTAFSPTLGHDLAVNTLLATLAATHHTCPDHALALWLSSRSAARLWGDWIRPDAYAHYQHGTTVLPFFLEHDTGTERPLARVEAKLDGYANLAATTGARPALLIHTSTARREGALRTRITEAAERLHLPVATSHTALTHQTAVSPPVWLPLNPTPAASSRLPLAGLAAHWPQLTPAFTDDTPLPAPDQPVLPLPPAGGHR